MPTWLSPDRLVEFNEATFRHQPVGKEKADLAVGPVFCKEKADLAVGPVYCKEKADLAVGLGVRRAEGFG
ncbi:hypothetical protein, partial [Mesorhizobium sp. B2-3-13]|uniref:hypothetical protein n=1 Tax=Mesorhizobium sp. B2-3-13 TaxID=2589951 RepID=UPI001AED28AB